MLFRSRGNAIDRVYEVKERKEDTASKPDIKYRAETKQTEDLKRVFNTGSI